MIQVPHHNNSGNSHIEHLHEEIKERVNPTRDSEQAMKQSRMAPPLHKLDGFLKRETKRLVTLQREDELKHPTEREETKLASWGYMERSS